MKLTDIELDRLFEELKRKRFVVVGDFCLDAYYFLDNAASEISVETGLRTHAVKYARFAPGGAGNVAANLAAMGAAHVHALGVFGDDLFGREYLSLLSSLGILTDRIVFQKKNWHTGVYTKLYDDDRELPRIDIGNHNRLTETSADQLLAHLERLLPETDAVLVNQQLTCGIHTPGFRKRLSEIIRAHPRKIFLLDSRHFSDDFPGTFRKLNHREAARCAGLDGADVDVDHVDTVCEAARTLYQRWGTPVFITRSERGGLVCDGQAIHQVPGLYVASPIDTVGAGDSILAGLAAGLAASLSNDRALLFAEFVAGVTVRKLFQTGTAGRDEIRTLALSPEFCYHPETAESLRAAAYWSDSEIEIVEPVFGRGFRYAVFDHDGTVSTMRQGWEAIMEPMMVEAILGDAGPTVSQANFDRVTAEVREFIEKTTGIQTLIQMVGLSQMVKDRGMVPEKDILTPLGYKKIYLNALDKVVQERVERLGRAKSSISDYTIRGSIRFLKALKERGVTLFLASGTDDADLHREAALLGYAELFNGGIYGATGSLENEPKRAVLKKILAEIGKEQGRRIITFGDGPVEMRETRKVEGRCVGVASDEIRRFGLNPDKRRRLILAGAQVIISDFSQYEKLLALLFP